MMNEVGFTLILARSAQAKGRVERLWDTLQSRLPVEFKIAGVANVDQVNFFLSNYIPIFNNSFAVEPENSQVAFKALSPKLNIDAVLCVKLAISVDAGGVFSFYNRHFTVVTNNNLPAIPQKAKINVLIGPRIGIKIQYKHVTFDTLHYIKSKKVSPTQVSFSSKYLFSTRFSLL